MLLSRASLRFNIVVIADIRALILMYFPQVFPNSKLYTHSTLVSLALYSFVYAGACM